MQLYSPQGRLPFRKTSSAPSTWEKRQELQKVNASLVVVARKYQDPEEGLDHEGLIDEVVSHCETSGVPIS